MNSLQFLVGTLFRLYMFVLALRIWFQFCRVDFYNPISQFIVKLTNPVLNPLRKIIPTVKNIDLAALFFIFFLGMIKLPLFAIFAGNWTSDLVSQNLLAFLIIGVLSVFKTLGQAIIYVLFAGAILSWFRRGNDSFSYLLYQLSEPILSPIRRFLPKTGMIDFSPMIVVFLLFWLDRLMYDLLPQLWAITSA